MDKMDDNELKLLKNKILSHTQKKYGTFPSEPVVNNFGIVNKHLPTQQEVEKYKCRFCKFHLNDFKYVRLHMMPTHTYKKEPEKPIGNPAAAKALCPERETEDSCSVTTRVMEPEPSMTQKIFDKLSVLSRRY